MVEHLTTRKKYSSPARLPHVGMYVAGPLQLITTLILGHARSAITFDVQHCPPQNLGYNHVTFGILPTLDTSTSVVREDKIAARAT